MKEEFNFESEVGRLAQCVSDKNWRGCEEPLKKLAENPQHEDVIPTVVNTVDYLAEKSGPQSTLYLIHGLLDGMKSPASIDGNYLQAKLVEKWDETLDIGLVKQHDSVLDYLGHACQKIAADHPLSTLVVPRWEKAIDAGWPLADFDLRYRLAVDHDIENPVFRHAVLKRLALLKDTEAETVFKMLTETFDRGGFYGFFEKDRESVGLIASTLAHILDAGKLRLTGKQREDVAWKLIASCSGSDAAAEQTGARIYMEIAAKEKDPQKAFNMYQGVVERRNSHIAAESRAAAEKILDLADAGMLGNQRSDGRDVMQCLSERIFTPALKEETKDEALAARAAATMLGRVRAALTGPEARSDYIHFNNAIALYEYFPLADPRSAEVKNLWETALTANYAVGDDYRTRQMGWMLDAAARKGDTLQEALALKEWRDGIDAVAQKYPQQAQRTVNEIVINAVHYKPGSALLAVAQAKLPEIEKLLPPPKPKMPEKMGSEDFLKMIGKKKEKGFKP